MKYAYNLSKSINKAVEMFCETKRRVNQLESN